MTTEKKTKCKIDRGCKPEVKAKHQNGKGDKPRPTDKNIYNKNYDKINWNKK